MAAKAESGCEIIKTEGQRIYPPHELRPLRNDGRAHMDAYRYIHYEEFVYLPEMQEKIGTCLPRVAARGGSHVHQVLWVVLA